MASQIHQGVIVVRAVLEGAAGSVNLPETPTILSVTPGPGTLEVAFQAGLYTTRMQLLLLDPFDTNPAVPVDEATSPHTFTGLMPGRNYNIIVTAFDVEGRACRVPATTIGIPAAGAAQVLPPDVTPPTFENSLRTHDHAIWKWLGGLMLDYGVIAGATRSWTPILRVFASPQRAVAAIVDMLVRQGWIDGGSAEEMRANAKKDFAILPLPLATIQRGDPALDPELRGTPKQLRRFYLNPETGRWEYHSWPAHYRTEYTITFWCLKEYSENYIREWVYGQLGKRGAAENEVFIEVEHKEPWQTLLQALRFDGSADESMLEGADKRWQRFTFTFSLRTWIMRVPEIGFEEVQGIGVDSCEPAGTYGLTDLSTQDLDTANLDLSANLFQFGIPDRLISTLWPKEGNATVARGSMSPVNPAAPPQTRKLDYVHPTLKVGVTSEGDAVELLERLIALDADGYAILDHSFRYLATEESVLQVKQRDPAGQAYELTEKVTLPVAQTWAKVHWFTVIREGVMQSEVRGTGGVAEVNVHAPVVRHIGSGTKINPSASTDVGLDILHEWFGLAKVPHLCILIVTATNGGSGSVTVEDDAATPTHTVVRQVDSSVNVGAVILAQPLGTSMSMRVPKTINVEAVYLQVYRGAYNGHSI